MAKAFTDLTEPEILALAIALEEDDARTYGDIAEALRDSSPATAELFTQMQGEEVVHRRRLTTAYRDRFGDTLPAITRHDVEGFLPRTPAWLDKSLSIAKVRKQAAQMEAETRRFYLDAAQRTRDLKLRELLQSLADEESGHIQKANSLAADLAPEFAAEDEHHATKKRKRFLLEVIQPGLAGLMDGSVSTLAPIFAAAFATKNNWDAFRVGLAASIGAGISMGFAEALSDDGQLSGRGRPLTRGFVCGLMTTAGGIGHTLPYLLPQTTPNAFQIATGLAILVVAIELAVISWVRHRFMESPWVAAAIQVVIGGIVVLVAGILIGGG